MSSLDQLDRLRAALGDRYLIEREIGAGGMARVFAAEDVRHGRQVAIKIFRPELAAVIGNERFFRETHIAANLHHPHILPLYDSGRTEDLLYYVMPLVEGQSLQHRLAEDGPLRIDEAIRIARQVAAALDYAHRKGVVHRDIKPGNILLHEGEALVADFGIALALHSAAGDRLTQTGFTVGTPAYMSPEQATGERTIDGRADTYSLACVVHEMLVGEPPFGGKTPQAVIARILTEPPPDIRAFRSTVPHPVAAAVRSALAKVPADRFETASEFVAALAGVGRPTPGAAARRIRHVGVAVSMALVLVLGVIGVWIATRDDATPAIGRDRLSLLLSTDGYTTDPALSPDGRLLAFARNEGGRTDIVVRLVSGGQIVRITDDDAIEGEPSFSPDGARVAFTRQDSAGAEPAIWIAPALGGQANRVVEQAHSPAWSPRGDELAYVWERTGEADVLARSGIDGAGRRSVFANAAPYLHVHTPSWSPDGTTIAFARSMGGASSEIWIVDADGGEARRLLDEGPAVASYQPVFTADGQALVHSSNRAGATNLWRMPLDGGRLVQLTTGSGPDAMPAVSSSGSIAFVNSRTRSTLSVRQLGTGDTRTLLAHTPYVWGPAIAPDGREIAFSRAGADGSWEIWIVPVEGGPARQLTGGALPTIYPRFTPDGRWVVYFTWTSGPSRVWRVPRDGGTAEPLTPEHVHAAYGDVSPDGRSLAYVREEGATPHLFIQPLDGGPARRLLESAATLPRWSPDGRWIAFARDRGLEAGIFIVRPDGSGERRLTPRGGWPVWWHDGSRIGFLRLGANGIQQIHTVPLDGGPSEHLDAIEFEWSNNPFDVSSDGRFLAFTDGIHLVDEIWLLDPEGPADD